jgi:hypothetical protein
MTVIENELPHNVKAHEDEHFTNSMLLPFLKKIRKILNFGMLPIGSVYITVLDANPATLLGYGKWEEIAQSRVLVGKEPALSDFDTEEKTGGALSHSHSTPTHQHELPLSYSWPYMYLSDSAEFGNSYHSDVRWAVSSTAGVSVPAIKTLLDGSSTTGTGSSIQPYYVVRMWKRTE